MNKSINDHIELGDVTLFQSGKDYGKVSIRVKSLRRGTPTHILEVDLDSDDVDKLYSEAFKIINQNKYFKKLNMAIEKKEDNYKREIADYNSSLKDLESIVKLGFLYE